MTTNQRLTPFQRDYVRMADALNVMLSSIGAADEALTRRIAYHDRGTDTSDKFTAGHEHTRASGHPDPVGNEAARREDAQLEREDYRDIAVGAIWDAIKAAQRATDNVLRNEPAITPEGARVCATVTKGVNQTGEPVEIPCTNFASNHQHPITESPINDLCDDCWRNICVVCYMRPKEQYRPTCDACRKRLERQRARREEAA